MDDLPQFDNSKEQDKNINKPSTSKSSSELPVGISEFPPEFSENEHTTVCDVNIINQDYLPEKELGFKTVCSTYDSFPICTSENNEYLDSSRSTSDYVDRDYSSSQNSIISDHSSSQHECYNKPHDIPRSGSPSNKSSVRSYEKCKSPTTEDNDEYFEIEAKPKDETVFQCDYHQQEESEICDIDIQEFKLKEITCAPKSGMKESPKVVDVPPKSPSDSEPDDIPSKDLCKSKEDISKSNDILRKSSSDSEEVKSAKSDNIPPKDLCECEEEIPKSVDILSASPCESDENISKSADILSTSPCESDQNISKSADILSESPCESLKEENSLPIEDFHENSTLCIEEDGTVQEEENIALIPEEICKNEDDDVIEQLEDNVIQEIKKFSPEFKFIFKKHALNKPISTSSISICSQTSKYQSPNSTKTSIESIEESYSGLDENIFPAKENYKKVIFNWEKYYDSSKGVENLKLLRNDRHRTELSFSKGSLISEGTEYALSETDFLQNGIHSLFLSTSEDKPKVPVPNIMEVMNSLENLPRNVEEVEKWLQKEKKSMEEINNNKKKFTKITKDLLIEIKDLKLLNTKLKKDVSILEDEINHYPSKEEIFTLKKKCQNLKDQINMLNFKHTKLLIKKEQLHEAIENESRTYYDNENNLLIQVEDLKEENKNIQSFVESFHRDATNAYNSLLERFNYSLQLIKNLNSLSELSKTLLERNCSLIKEMEELVEENNTYLKKLHENIDNTEKYIENFNFALDPLTMKSNGIMDYINNLGAEMKELEKNFNSVSDFLCEQEIKNIQVKGTLTEIYKMFELLKEEKTRILDIKNHIRKLEKLIKEEMNIRKAEKSKFSKEIEFKKSQGNYNFDEKLTRLFSFLEEVEETVAELKAEQGEDIKIKDEVLKYEFRDDVEEQDRVKFSETFICSDVTKEGVCTLTGLSSFEEVKYPKQISDDIPESLQIRKSWLSCGYKNLKSVPEDIHKQLTDIYGTFESTDAICTQFQDS